MMNTPAGWLQWVIKYFSSSIRKKIITPYAILTLILAAMGIFIIARFVAGSFEARLKNQLLEAGRVVSEETVNRERTRLEIERLVVNTQGVSEALVNRNTDEMEDLISPIIANAKMVDSIIVVDTQAREVLRFQRETVGPSVFVNTQTDSGVDLSGWAAVTQVLQDTEGVKQVQLARDTELDQLIIYTVGPVRDASNNVVGAALVGTYLEKELEVLRNLALAHLTLFDDNGKVLATTLALTAEEKQEIFQIFTPQRYREVINNNQVTLLDEIEVSEQNTDGQNVDIRGQSYRLAYAPYVLRGQVFGVYAVALPTNFITNTTSQSRNLLVALFTAGVITVIGIGFYISHRITQPILRLVQTSKAISAGDLEQRTGLLREDEIGTLATTFDQMTAELQRLLQLQKEEASKLNAILNSIADGVVVQDQRGEILVTNPAAEKILKVIGDNLIQASLKNGQFERGSMSSIEQQTSKMLNRLTNLEFGEVHRFEIGRQAFSALSAPVITPDGVQLGSVVVLRDITREVESEKLKDEFITSISHELKTPLTAIKGYNSLLKMMIEMSPGDMAERQLSIVGTMDKEVTDLDNIIQAMLDLSQIDAGELGIDQVPVNLSQLIEEVGQEWSEKMEERELSFNLDLPKEPVWVAGDQKRLSRVVHNLLKNAHDYTLPTGQVEVAVSQKNGRGRVDIKDTGVGIKDEDQRFLFTKFFRAIHEESHFGEVSGAGLGLYTSKAIVEAHNGKMWMESKENEGSVFSFSLPAIDPEAEDDWAEDDWTDVEEPLGT